MWYVYGGYCVISLTWIVDIIPTLDMNRLKLKSLWSIVLLSVESDEQPQHK